MAPVSKQKETKKPTFIPAPRRGPETPKAAKPRRSKLVEQTAPPKPGRLPFQIVDKSPGQYSSEELRSQLCITAGEWVNIQEEVKKPSKKKNLMVGQNRKGQSSDSVGPFHCRTIGKQLHLLRAFSLRKDNDQEKGASNYPREESHLVHQVSAELQHRQLQCSKRIRRRLDFVPGYNNLHQCSLS